MGETRAAGSKAVRIDREGSVRFAQPREARPFRRQLTSIYVITRGCGAETEMEQQSLWSEIRTPRCEPDFAFGTEAVAGGGAARPWPIIVGVLCCAE